MSYRVEVYEQITTEVLARDIMRGMGNPVVEKEITAPALSWTPSSGECLARGMNYVWYVRGVDPEGQGQWSEGTGFQVAASVLSEELKEAIEDEVKTYLSEMAASSAGATGSSSGVTLLNAPSAEVKGEVSRSRAQSGITPDVGFVTFAPGIILDGDVGVNDKGIYLRNDFYHGIRWAGAGKEFAGVNVNGPVLFGADGGALGTTNGDQQHIALRWDTSGVITANGGAMTGDLRMNNNNIWLRGGSDVNHGVGWYGAGKLFADTNVDGPVVYGWSGGALGSTADGQQKIALLWNGSGNVGVGTESPGEKLSVAGTIESTSGGIKFPDGSVQVTAARDCNGGRYEDNGNGTVSDCRTGLIWLKNASCTDTVGGKTPDPAHHELSWDDAKTWTANLKNGNCGLSDDSIAGDWRLPTRLELMAMVESAKKQGITEPCITNSAGTGRWTDGDPFLNVDSEYAIWSSSTGCDFYSPDICVWVLNLHFGFLGKADGCSGFCVAPPTQTFRVWPVRAGQ